MRRHTRAPVTSGTSAINEMLKGTKKQFLDKDEPHSLFNLLTPALVARVSRIPDEYFGLSESELAAKIHENKPTKRIQGMSLENRVRLAFWREYVAAINSGEKMRPQHIWRGVTSCEYFYLMMDRPLQAAWILNPPPEESLILEESYAYALQKVREILDMPLYKVTGEADAPVAGQILRAAEFLGNRLHGAPTQKIESKTLRVNVGGRMLKAASPGPTGEYKIDSYDSVGSEIRFLEEKTRAAEEILKGKNAEGTTEKETD